MKKLEDMSRKELVKGFRRERREAGQLRADVLQLTRELEYLRAQHERSQRVTVTTHKDPTTSGIAFLLTLGSVKAQAHLSDAVLAAARKDEGEEELVCHLAHSLAMGVAGAVFEEAKYLIRKQGHR